MRLAAVSRAWCREPAVPSVQLTHASFLQHLRVKLQEGGGVVGLLEAAVDVLHQAIGVVRAHFGQERGRQVVFGSDRADSTHHHSCVAFLQTALDRRVGHDTCHDCGVADRRVKP